MRKLDKEHLKKTLKIMSILIAVIFTPYYIGLLAVSIFPSSFLADIYHLSQSVNGTGSIQLWMNGLLCSMMLAAIVLFVIGMVQVFDYLFPRVPNKKDDEE